MKNPKVPKQVIISTHVGEQQPQLPGMKSLCREVTTITKRSIHIPILTNPQMSQMNQGVVRHHLNQKNCGASTLQLIIHQQDQFMSPKARFLNAYNSFGLIMSGNTTSLSIRYDLRYVNNPNMYLHLFLGKFKDYYKKLLQKISSFIHYASYITLYIFLTQ